MYRTKNRLHDFKAASALVLGALMTAPGFAQDPVIGPQIRIDVGGTTFAANETSIASSDAAPLEVVGTWNDWRRSGGSEIINMGVAVSNDGGVTWEDFLVRPPAGRQTNVEGDPMTAYDNRTGTLWVGAIAFSGTGGVYVAKKIPGQNAFEPSVMTYTLSGADKCWMAAGPAPDDPDSTNVYVAFNRGLQRSVDMGQTWNAPRSLGSGIGFLPRVGPNGEVYTSFWDFGSGVMMARSFDGGNTNQTIRIATRMDTWGTQDGSRFAGRFRSPSFSHIALDPNTGDLYAVWPDTTERNGTNYNVDLYFSKSADRGDTWTQPRVLNGDGNPPGDQFFPWIEVDQRGRLHILFYDSRGIVQNDNDVHGLFNAYYAYSDDQGDTWHEFLLTPEPFDSDNDGLNRSTQFIGDYSGLAVGANRVYPCYLSTQNGDSDIFSHVIVTPTSGFPGSFEIPFGLLQSGGISDLFSSDDRYLAISPIRPDVVADPSAQLVVTGSVEEGLEPNLRFTVETRVAGEPARQRVELFNYSDEQWQEFDERDAPMADTVIEIDAPAIDFVQPGTGEVKARISVIDHGVTMLNWPTFIDRTTWKKVSG
jgi:hypothetical protein